MKSIKFLEFLENLPNQVIQNNRITIIDNRIKKSSYYYNDEPPYQDTIIGFIDKTNDSQHIFSSLYKDLFLEDITYLISQGSDITLIFGKDE